MKKLILAALMTALCLGAWFGYVSAIKISEAKIELPVGTKVERVTRFILADGVIELVSTAGESVVRVYNENGKLIHMGKEPKIISGRKARQLPMDKVSKLTKIDDDPTWISFTIVPGEAGIIDPDPPGRELSPQPDPPGKR